jgi:hypothetical protein
VNAAIVDGIVKAVLYEGYMLYPYRPSSVKNRQRFNFGVIYPRAYSETQGGTDAWTTQTECLVTGDGNSQCTVRVRFLRMVARSLEKLLTPSSDCSAIAAANVAKVERLEVGGKIFQSWQEAVEETIAVADFSLLALCASRTQWPFELPAMQEKEPVRDENGLTAGIIVRDKSAVTGRIDCTAVQLEEKLFKLTVAVSNVTPMDVRNSRSRDEALVRSLVSAHTILELNGGAFVSLLDPPEEFRAFARACQNVGTWPVLVGEAGQRDTMLSSPIILYDYPEIAPESPGDLFDGAEIDEILLLRIMTLTEDEKLEMRNSDDRARQILERTSTLPEEQFMKLHGALRGLRSTDLPAAKGDAP